MPYNLRDPTRTIIPKSNSTTYGIKSLKHEGNKIWNQLQADIKTLKSLAIFKIKINKWLRRFQKSYHFLLYQGFKYTIFNCFYPLYIFKILYF